MAAPRRRGLGLRRRPERQEEPGTPTGEVRVSPGLAVDAAGHELYLDNPVCMDLVAWFEKHAEDANLEVEETETGVRFTTHVVVRLKTCATRPVPALAEPCEGATSDTAYSRTLETVEILMRPGPAPPHDTPYHRLRLLFHLTEPRLDQDGNPLPADQEVLDARTAILALPGEQQPAAYLEAFRRFAALDQIELQPEMDEDGGSTPFAAADAPPVVLAELRDIELARDGESWRFTGAELDRSVRHAHVATATIQELLCGPLFGLGAFVPPPPGEGAEGEEEEEGEGGDEGGVEEGGAGPSDEFEPVEIPTPPPVTDESGEEDEEPPSEDGVGPRVDPTSVTVRGETIQFRLDKPLSAASVRRRAFEVSSYDRRDGWHDVEIRTVEYDRRRNQMTIHLRSAPGGNLVRIRARGTGPRPILGTDLVPLAGLTTDPPASRHEGRDFVFMLKRR